jgi:hypothetical protein
MKDKYCLPQPNLTDADISSETGFHISPFVATAIAVFAHIEKLIVSHLKLCR